MIPSPEPRPPLPVLLVGEDNPHSADPRVALWDAPPGCAGARLRDILGVDRRVYRRTERMNLCVGAWSASEARRRAAEVLVSHGRTHLLVLLGRKVATAFGCSSWPLMRRGMIWLWHDQARSLPGGAQVVLLPHPSGRNLLWNDPRATEDVRWLLREARADLPVPEPGETAPSALDMLRGYLAGG